MYIHSHVPQTSEVRLRQAPVSIAGEYGTWTRRKGSRDWTRSRSSSRRPWSTVTTRCRSQCRCTRWWVKASSVVQNARGCVCLYSVCTRVKNLTCSYAHNIHLYVYSICLAVLESIIFQQMFILTCIISCLSTQQSTIGIRRVFHMAIIHCRATKSDIQVFHGDKFHGLRQSKLAQ